MADSENRQRLNLPPHIPESPAQPQRLVLSKAQLIYSKHHGLIIKGAFITVAIAMLPLCSSQTSAFTNSIIFNRGWEFLRLVFVSAALSYGLFSFCQDKAEKEVEVEIESTHNYVSKILQVSTVFEDELEDGAFCDASKIQTWNSLYSPCESMIMVDENDRNRHDRTLFLPVRSLRSCISESEETTLVDDSETGLPETENSRSRNRFRNAKRGNAILLPRSDTTEVVLPSPIPWRSRSGRLSVKPDILLLPQSPSLVGPNSGSEPESREIATPELHNLISSPLPQSSSSLASSSISPSCSVSQTSSTASDQESADDSVSSPMDGVHSPHNRFNSINQKLNRNLKHSESFGGSVAVKSVGSIRKCESFNPREGDGRTERRDRGGIDQRMSEGLMVRNRHSDHVAVVKENEQNDGIKNKKEKKSAVRSRDEFAAAMWTPKNRETDGLLVGRIHRKTSFQAPPPPPPIEMYERYQRNRRMAREFVEKLKGSSKAPVYIDHVEEEEGSVNDDDDDDDDNNNDGEDGDEADKDDDEYSDDEATTSTESMKEINADEVDRKADEFIAKFRQQMRLQRPNRLCNQKIQSRRNEDDSTG